MTWLLVSIIPYGFAGYLLGSLAASWSARRVVVGPRYRLMRFWPRRHRCPPCVSLRILVNDQLVVGPVTGEQLAYIVRFGNAGDDSVMDLLGPENLALRSADVVNVKVLAEYIPA